MFEQKYNVHDKNYTIPADLNLAMRHTILSAIDLCDILERETNALKNSQTGLFLDIQSQKSIIAARYEMLARNLIARGDDVKNADQRLKENLEKIQKEFGLVSEENLMWVSRVKKASKRFQDRVMLHAKNSFEKQSQFAYEASGKMHKSNRTLNGLDEQV